MNVAYNVQTQRTPFEYRATLHRATRMTLASFTWKAKMKLRYCKVAPEEMYNNIAELEQSAAEKLIRHEGSRKWVEDLEMDKLERHVSHRRDEPIFLRIR